ncbi:MAG TPA: hypothetical protein PK876_06205 [Elusimicrobiota bacterium]|nr:hypothetical protein [Elusimicrobiota bacterium]
MEAVIKIIAGLLFLFLSLSYLYRPAWILKINAAGRQMLFNDAHVLLFRRRWGLLFLVSASVFLYAGFNNLAYQAAPSHRSSYWDLQDAYRSLRVHHYKGVVVRCQEILKREPDNIHAWVLLGTAWSSLGRKDQSRQAWKRVLEIQPDYVGLTNRIFPAAELENVPPETGSDRAGQDPTSKKKDRP